MTYARRTIDLKFQLGQGAFGESGFDTVELAGLRVSASIQRIGGVSYSTASIRAYGVPLSVMNDLSTLGMLYPDVRRNLVTITAGDSATGKAVAGRQ